MTIGPIEIILFFGATSNGGHKRFRIMFRDSSIWIAPSGQGKVAT
jgi:hypothetical protein